MSTTLCSSLWFCCSADIRALAALMISRLLLAGSVRTPTSFAITAFRTFSVIGQRCMIALAISRVSRTGILLSCLLASPIALR